MSNLEKSLGAVMKELLYHSFRFEISRVISNPKSFCASVYRSPENCIEINVDTKGRITIILKTDVAHKAGFSTDKAKPFSSNWRKKGFSHLDYGFKIDDFRIDLEKILLVMDDDANKQDSAERQE